MKKLIKRIAKYFEEIKKNAVPYGEEELYTDPRLNLWLNMDADMPVLIM